MADLFEADPVPTPAAEAPLAERLRPASLDEVIGQEHLTGPDGPIGRMVAAGRLSSLILWGPPGTGKTTIARLLAGAVGYRYVAISAVFSGVADLKKVFAEAEMHARSGKHTLLFVDEIHRFILIPPPGNSSFLRRHFRGSAILKWGTRTLQGQGSSRSAMAG